MNANFIKVVKVTDPLNWWNREGILGQTFEVVEIVSSPFFNKNVDWVKIEYEEGFFGWIPLNMCEINPHLKIVSNS